MITTTISFEEGKALALGAMLLAAVTDCPARAFGFPPEIRDAATGYLKDRPLTLDELLVMMHKLHRSAETALSALQAQLPPGVRP